GPPFPPFSLPVGAPPFPLSPPGVRVGLKRNDTWSLKLGVYNGDPAGAHCTGNPQACDDNGLDFRLDTPPLMIVEGSYKYNQDGQLPGTVESRSAACSRTAPMTLLLLASLIPAYPMTCVASMGVKASQTPAT